jgi:hypothetical protein
MSAAEPHTNAMFRSAFQLWFSSLLLAIVIVWSSLTLFGRWGILPAAILFAIAAYVRMAGSMLQALKRALLVTFCATCLICVISAPFAIENARAVARRTMCANNMKQIGLALQDYRKAKGRYPPAQTLDRDGQPMHSWRLLILPFLGLDDLYNACNLNEPWDGPSNAKFTAGTPVAMFVCPSDHLLAPGSGGTMTSYLAVVGPGTPWGDVASGRPGSPANSSDKRVLVVEAANSGIAWGQPQDLTLEEACRGIGDEPGQRISSKHGDFSGWPFYHDAVAGAHVLRADGSVQFLPAGMPPEVLKGVLLGDEDKWQQAATWKPKRRIHWPNCIALASLALAILALMFLPRKRREQTPTDAPPIPNP